ncbi:hypothetical protein VTN77DRAFT_4009 [Rasamsonia byssochlamydoides]|uniref:uncharacterized protein n=1 Tax=Rasamsonia byssochlamydoides TaxID=89139 RepID=UPI00374295F8
MAPIRRYLRISKYSVLECRIYLENPADTRWLLDSRDPVLPRIFAAIKPLVLPKLREENERALAKKKSNPVKDVIVEDDFEVAIFLRESGTRHSILTRHKTFGEAKKIESNSNKLTGVDACSADTNIESGRSIMIDSDEEPEIDLANIPEAISVDTSNDRSKRRRQSNGGHAASKRSKTEDNIPEDPDADDDKKLRLATRYEGFSIWGWVLCLLVTRRGQKTRPSSTASEAPGQVLMEEWISSQVQPDLEDE